MKSIQTFSKPVIMKTINLEWVIFQPIPVRIETAGEIKTT